MLSARSPVCGRPQKEAWSAGWTQIRHSRHRLGPGNTNVRCWGGIPAWGGIPGGYYPPTHPVYPSGRPRDARVHRSTGTLGHAHMTSFRRPKEILGVEYAQGTPRQPHAHLTQARSLPWSLLCGPAVGCCRAFKRAAPQIPHILSISQYFSVFLEISQYISVFLSISQYFSVFYVARLQGRGTRLGPAAGSMRSC